MTRVFAAHRPDTVAIADRVISLAKAGVIETNGSGNRTVPQTGVDGRQRSWKGESYVKQ
jgi:hypothetical protein